MNEVDDNEDSIVGADVLYKTVRRMCEGLTVPSIGTALTAVLVDFAIHIDMSKEDLLQIVSDTWDVTMEDEVKH
jgi:hypothetical protein